MEDGYFSQTEQTEGNGKGSGETIRGNACIVKASGACRVDTGRVSISSRFISLQSITDFDRELFVNFLLSSTAQNIDPRGMDSSYLPGVEMVYGRVDP